jgi:hypothetical protein
VVLRGGHLVRHLSITERTTPPIGVLPLIICRPLVRRCLRLQNSTRRRCVRPLPAASVHIAWEWDVASTAGPGVCMIATGQRRRGATAAAATRNAATSPKFQNRVISVLGKILPSGLGTHHRHTPPQSTPRNRRRESTATTKSWSPKSSEQRAV